MSTNKTQYKNDIYRQIKELEGSMKDEFANHPNIDKINTILINTDGDKKEYSKHKQEIYKLISEILTDVKFTEWSMLNTTKDFAYTEDYIYGESVEFDTDTDK